MHKTLLKFLVRITTHVSDCTNVETDYRLASKNKALTFFNVCNQLYYRLVIFRLG